MECQECWNARMLECQECQNAGMPGMPENARMPALKGQAQFTLAIRMSRKKYIPRHYYHFLRSDLCIFLIRHTAPRSRLRTCEPTCTILTIIVLYSMCVSLDHYSLEQSDVFACR